MTVMRNAQSVRRASIAVAAAVLCTLARGQIIYVDENATGDGSGRNWSNAFVHLQDALTRAAGLPVPVEIRVAKGLYRPDLAADRKLGDTSATFELLNNVSLKGGFAGAGTPDPNTRDVGGYETILSGDLAGNDGPGFSGYEDNTRTIVTSISNDATAVLDGFTITGGFGESGPGLDCQDSRPIVEACTFRANMATGRDGGYGGAVSVSGGAPVFSRCAFAGNWAMNHGGAIRSKGRAHLTVLRCAFTDNCAANGGAIHGAASDVNAVDCTFADNLAEDHGGAVYCHQGKHVVAGCAFVANSARYGGAVYNLFGWMSMARCRFTANEAWEGGGVYIDSSAAVTLTHCLLAGNRARDWGGAVLSWCDSSPKLTNCTIAENRAPEGSAISGGEPILWNCVVWDQEPVKSLFRILGDGPTAGYSCIQGGFSGPGNIDTDPLFGAPGYWDANNTPQDMNDDTFIDGDYHLKSQAGRWDPNSEGWTVDEAHSRCIDAGDPDSDVGDEPFPNGGIINMGAYGGTAEASKSPGVSPPCGQTMYEFVRGQSVVTQTGGLAGVDWTYRIEGQFHVALDCLTGVASFPHVDAVATDESSSPPRELDLDETFQMTSLIGRVGADGTLFFSGKSTDESDVAMTLTFRSDSVRLTGTTTPPAGSADFFVFSINATARRSADELR